MMRLPGYDAWKTTDWEYEAHRERELECGGWGLCLCGALVQLADDGPTLCDGCGGEAELDEEADERDIEEAVRRRRIEEEFDACDGPDIDDYPDDINW